jgi:hypothetical protein
VAFKHASSPFIDSACSSTSRVVSEFEMAQCCQSILHDAIDRLLNNAPPSSHNVLPPTIRENRGAAQEENNVRGTRCSFISDRTNSNMVH